MAMVVLAKSCRNPDNPQDHETLAGHCVAVGEAFKGIMGTDDHPSELGLCWLRFFRVPEEKWPLFWNTGLAASLLHDVGKANDSFQKAVRMPETKRTIRHEHLSALILHLPVVREWLDGFYSWEGMVCAVVGHHLRFKFESFCQRGERDGFSIFPETVNQILNDAATCLGLPTQNIAGSIPECWTFEEGRRGSVPSAAEETKKRLYRMKKKLRECEVEHRLLRAIRAALVLADSAGSAIPREGLSLGQWLENCFSPDSRMYEQDIQEKVIRPRIEQISRNKPFAWNSFQAAAENLGDRALLMTPCGSGKTLAAWRWIASRLRRFRASRVIFLYPTRGTATEGFRDYVSWAPESDAALITGTARFDLEGMFTSPDDDRAVRNFLADDRLYALGFWPRRIFAATVDQFLGFMQHAYGATCLLPLLADSILVFDEVHSFDAGLYSALKSFLREFDVPVLCVTASLGANRVEDFKELGLNIFPESVQKSCFDDLKKRADKLRYQVESLETPEAARLTAREALRDGKRVLWVVNTTERCRAIARELKALCYHSRFRLKDRRDRHEAVIGAFQQRCTSALAVTTQVCEMSLDLDADVLISEQAPVTAMIQRMGRCNRHDYSGEERIGNVYFYLPENDKPYSREELQESEAFVRELQGKLVSQSDLQALLEVHGPTQVEVERWQAFLQSGVEACAREASLRETDDFTVSAILDSDVDEYCELRRCRNPRADGLILPVPRKQAQSDSRLPGTLKVADSRDYDMLLGFGGRTGKDSVT